jgi:hypothetical protein
VPQRFYNGNDTERRFCSVKYKDITKMQDCKQDFAKMGVLQERIHKNYIDFFVSIVYDILANYGMLIVLN